MPNGDYRSAASDALANLALAIKDAAQLSVETYIVDLDKPAGDPARERVVARTVLELDGDARVYVPVRDVAGAPQIEATLYTEHKMAVDQARQARTELLNAVKGLLGELKNLVQ
jgi:hypothetical protein